MWGMKRSAYKFLLLLLVSVIIVLCLLNNRYEVFALNVTRGMEKEEGNIRVMTYNVNASLRNGDAGDALSGIIDAVEKHNPDIVCFQELSPTVFSKIKYPLDSLFGYSDSMSIKKEKLRYWLYSKKPIRNFTRYKFLTEIDTVGFDSITKIEIKQVKRGMPVYSAEIEVEPDKWIKVFSVHLRSSAYSTARRSMDEGASWMDGIPLYYENYKKGQKIRNWEADNLRQHLDSLEAEDTPVIIAGDFNDWSGSYCMNAIRKGIYKDAWWEGGFGFGITYDAWHLKLRLDHILYSRHFRLENVYVEKSKFSDHRPLIADFRTLL